MCTKEWWACVNQWRSIFNFTWWRLRTHTNTHTHTHTHTRCLVTSTFLSSPLLSLFEDMQMVEKCSTLFSGVRKKKRRQRRQREMEEDHLLHQPRKKRQELREEESHIYGVIYAVKFAESCRTRLCRTAILKRGDGGIRRLTGSLVIIALLLSVPTYEEKLFQFYNVLPVVTILAYFKKKKWFVPVQEHSNSDSVALRRFVFLTLTDLRLKIWGIAAKESPCAASDRRIQTPPTL